jgi:hypothetical protein
MIHSWLSQLQACAQATKKETKLKVDLVQPQCYVAVSDSKQNDLNDAHTF